MSGNPRQVRTVPFKLVEQFWAKRGNAPDAVEVSEKAQEQASEVLKSVIAKDYDAASTESHQDRADLHGLS